MSAPEPRQQRKKWRIDRFAPKAAQGVSPRSAVASDPLRSEREEVARLAYSYWVARGRQGGSPEDDWLRAEAEYRARERSPVSV